MRHTRPRAFPRPAQPSAATLRIERARWVRLLAEGRDHGRRAAAGEPWDRTAVWGLTRQVIEVGKTPFPLEGRTVRTMAGAFLELSASLTDAAVMPDRRAAAGACVAAIGEALERLLDLDRTAAFQATTGKQFKDD